MVLAKYFKIELDVASNRTKNQFMLANQNILAHAIIQTFANYFLICEFVLHHTDHWCQSIIL